MDELLYHVFAENVGRYLDGIDRLAARLAACAPPNSIGGPCATGATGSSGPTDQARQTGAADPTYAECSAHAVRELRRLVAAWRALLAMHRPEGRHCTGCARSRPGRRGAMCTVWRVANAYFVRRLPDDEPVTS